MDEVAAWFELFRAFGRAPSPDSYAAVFHPEGEVADAGMATPTPASQVRDAIAHVLRLMPDLRIDMKRYRARGPVVFVEAENRGTINGTAVDWGAVYRVHLRDTASSIAAGASTTRRPCSAPCGRIWGGWRRCRRRPTQGR